MAACHGSDARESVLDQPDATCLKSRRGVARGRNRLTTQQIIVFGAGEIAELADFYFTHDSRYEVAGFTVDSAYLKATEFRGRPVVAFEDVAEKFPPELYGFFV